MDAVPALFDTSKNVLKFNRLLFATNTSSSVMVITLPVLAGSDKLVNPEPSPVKSPTKVPCADPENMQIWGWGHSFS